MQFDRRAFLSALAAQARLTAQERRLGIPGPFAGRVVAVEHPGSILEGVYQREPVREMMRRGMMELTGAPSWQDAWRVFFEPGDVVIIKVNPVGQPYIISSAEVFQEIVAGLEAAGVKRGDIFAYDRYQSEFLSGGFQKWLPDGVRWSCATVKYDKLQLDMDGYDRDQYIELPLVGTGHDPRDPHHRRSYVAKLLSQTANKAVNLGVLKHHQSAGITIALKNLSHGFVNNVARSHVSRTNNACGMFIPAVVDHPVFRQKVVLNIIDGIKGAYHGGPARRTARYLWEHKTLYFGTDPVALDRVGWNVLDMKRGQMGMAPIALAADDQDSNFIRMQPEHVELASMLGLGVADEDKIDLRRIRLG
jgi:uncharacterized protein (DUF362 family)